MPLIDSKNNSQKCLKTNFIKLRYNYGKKSFDETMIFETTRRT